MKKYEIPEIEVLEIKVQDVVTTSGDEWDGDNGGNNTGWN